MPKKQNGFGNPDSFSIKGFDKKANKGKASTSHGVYPGKRHFGTSVHRSVIEKYDIDSDWTRWRKGVEYYYLGAYLQFEGIDTVLYQGTPDSTLVHFDGNQFATTNSDSRSHYAARRTVIDNKELGVVVEKKSNRIKYLDNFERRELWVKVKHADATQTSRMRRVIGERLTDGNTSANVMNVLTADGFPTVYSGKTEEQKKVEILIEIPLAEILSTEFIERNKGDIFSLEGSIGYFPQFLVERNTSGSDVYENERHNFYLTISDVLTNKEFRLLENTTDLPPALLDISGLPSIYTTSDATTTVDARFNFQKKDYQRFFGDQYLTGDVVAERVTELNYAILPFQIRSVVKIGDKMQLTAEPVNASVKLFTPGELENYIIFYDGSFTKIQLDVDSDGKYLHDPPAPGEPHWRKLITDVDPWYDPIFTTGEQLRFDEVFCCSCPDFAHAVIRMPEAVDDQGGITNRQRRYPLPSAMSSSSYEGAGFIEAAGVVQSWETSRYRSSFRLCKHTIATMFNNKIKVQEPKSYPSFDSRIKFEQKLKKDIDEVVAEFNAQLKRSSITTAEVVFMLAQGLNLDDFETAYVMLNAKF